MRIRGEIHIWIQPNYNSPRYITNIHHYSSFTENWINYKVTWKVRNPPWRCLFNSVPFKWVCFSKIVIWSHGPYGHFGSSTLAYTCNNIMYFAKPVFPRNAKFKKLNMFRGEGSQHTNFKTNPIHIKANRLSWVRIGRIQPPNHYK